MGLILKHYYCKLETFASKPKCIAVLLCIFDGHFVFDINAGQIVRCGQRLEMNKRPERFESQPELALSAVMRLKR